MHVLEARRRRRKTCHETQWSPLDGGWTSRYPYAARGKRRRLARMTGRSAGGGRVTPCRQDGLSGDVPRTSRGRCPVSVHAAGSGLNAARPSGPGRWTSVDRVVRSAAQSEGDRSAVTRPAAAGSCQHLRQKAQATLGAQPPEGGGRQVHRDTRAASRPDPERHGVAGA